MQTPEIAHHAVRSNSGSRVFVETPGKVGPFRLLSHLVKDLRMTGWLKGLTRDIHAHNTIKRHLLMRQPTPSIYYPPRYIPPSFPLPRRTSTMPHHPKYNQTKPQKALRKNSKNPQDPSHAPSLQQRASSVLHTRTNVSSPRSPSHVSPFFPMFPLLLLLVFTIGY